MLRSQGERRAGANALDGEMSGAGLARSHYNRQVRVSQALRSAAEIRGWNWSPMRDRMEPFGWSYPELLADYVGQSMRTLDVGTGGGEIFAAAARPQDIALDVKAARLAVARTILTCPLVRADYEALPFPTGAFDLVTDRHAGAPPHEVLRVLAPGGIYLTQQPGGHICQNIFDALGWGSNEQWWQRDAAEHGYEHRDVNGAAQD